MKTEVGALFRDRDQDSRRSSERAESATERPADRDPITSWHADFRQRARGEVPNSPNEGEQE